MQGNKSVLSFLPELWSSTSRKLRRVRATFKVPEMPHLKRKVMEGPLPGKGS